MTSATGSPGWLRVYRRVGFADVRLVCFPHAGGTATFFQSWAARLTGAVDLLAVCYPGRQDRLLEPCVEDMGPLADRITDALEPYLDRPLAFFGHSMGASVAYEVTLRLAARHGFTPAHLFVSGHGAPHIAWVDDDPDRYDDEELCDRIGGLGEVDPIVFRSPKLRELIAPALRADLRLVHRYLPRDQEKVSVPISAYLGAADPVCTVDDVSAWAELTTGEFEVRTFRGDHFYLVPEQAALLDAVSARLSGGDR